MSQRWWQRTRAFHRAGSSLGACVSLSLITPLVPVAALIYGSCNLFLGRGRWYFFREDFFDWLFCICPYHTRWRWPLRVGPALSVNHPEHFSQSERRNCLHLKVGCVALRPKHVKVQYVFHVFGACLRTLAVILVSNFCVVLCSWGSSPFIPTVPYSGRATGFVSLQVLAVGNFGILLTCTSEEGLPLFKDEAVEYFSLLVFWRRPLAECKDGKDCCIRVFIVNKTSGHTWVNVIVK